jgi:hypothetical protein
VLSNPKRKFKQLLGHESGIEPGLYLLILLIMELKEYYSAVISPEDIINHETHCLTNQQIEPMEAATSSYLFSEVKAYKFPSCAPTISVFPKIRGLVGRY